MGKNYKSNNIPQIKIGETIISDDLMQAESRLPPIQRGK